MAVKTSKKTAKPPAKKDGSESYAYNPFGLDNTPYSPPAGQQNPFDFWSFTQSGDAATNKELAGKGLKKGRGVAPPVQSETAPPGLTFADYLAMANAMGLGGGDGTNYGALMDQLRTNAGSADTKLEAMYRQLRGSIDADAAPIKQSYDQAGRQIQQSGDEARQQTNAGFDRARETQAQQFRTLGIEDAAGVLAANGGAAGNDQAVANANILQDQQAGKTQNTQNGASALDYNTNIGNAAGLEGNVQRAAIQQQLADKLAELQVAQGESQRSGQSNAFNAAFQMAQNPGIFDPNHQEEMSLQDQLQARLLAGQVTAQDYKNQALAANSGQGVGANLTQYQTLAQAYGVDPSDPVAFLDFIKMVNATR